MFVLVGSRCLGAAEADRQAGQGRGVFVAGIGAHRLLVGEILDAQRRHFRTAPATGSEGG